MTSECRAKITQADIVKLDPGFCEASCVRLDEKKCELNAHETTPGTPCRDTILKLRWLDVQLMRLCEKRPVVDCSNRKETQDEVGKLM
jgi:hypothetical protein